jgi:hypothetical protein
MNVETSVCKVLVILMELEFSRNILEKRSNIKFYKTHPVGAELFHADGLTDGWMGKTKVIVAFRNFVNAPKNLLPFNASAYTLK